MTYNQHKSYECTCWGVSWSMSGRFALATFSKQAKKRNAYSAQQLESALFVYEIGREILRRLDRETTPLKFDH